MKQQRRRNSDMKKRLLVILGAGSSIARGMPSVSALDQFMRQWAHQWSSSHGFPDYYESLERSVEAYYSSGPSGDRPVSNFEKVLGDLLALSHWVTPAPWGDTLREVAAGGQTLPELYFPPTSPSGGEEPYGGSVMLKDQLQHLLTELVRHIRSLCRRLNRTDQAACQYKTLFDGLRDAFDLGVYNLNYDIAALSACPDAYTGFGDNGIFDARQVHARTNWDFVYHLHGSVHHSLAGVFSDEIRWNWDLSGEFCDGHQGQAGDKRSEGRSFPKTTLIAGGFKLDQLLVEPFHSFHAALVRHVYAADAILIGGYGFADVHINRALRNRLVAREHRPPAMILDLAGNRTDPMAWRYDAWAYELCAALNASGHVFSEPGHSSPTAPSELLTRGAFEVTTPHRVALWYGGFGAAAGRLDGILPWLDGAADEVLAPASPEI
jgi:hypothetical protein